MNITVYQNNYNENKFIEVHNDNYGHYSVKQYMKWNNGKISQTGDGKLHRTSKYYIDILIKDYKKIP